MAKHDIDPVLQQLAQAINESGQGAVPARGTVLPGALIAEQAYFRELVGENPLMSALDPSSGLLGEEYAKDAETASGRHLHMRAAGVRGGGEVTEGLWHISLEAVDGWTSGPAPRTTGGRSPGCSATRDAAWRGSAVGVPCG